LRLSEEIRAGFEGTVELDLSARGFRKGLSRANTLLAEAEGRGLDPGRLFAVLLGDRERAEQTVTIKALASGTQETVARRELARRLSAGSRP
jgi:histidyl-tRNA synthetase